MRGLKPLALLIVLAAASSPAGAQCRLCAEPAPAPGQDAPVDLQIETDLDFGRLILTGAGAGAATIRPDGSSGAEGSVMGLGPRTMVGTVLVHGAAGRALRVDLPRRVELFSLGGGRLTLDDVSTDLPALPRLDAAGKLSFHFGGRLILSGDA